MVIFKRRKAGSKAKSSRRPKTASRPKMSIKRKPLSESNIPGTNIEKSIHCDNKEKPHKPGKTCLCVSKGVRKGAWNCFDPEFLKGRSKN